MEKLLMTKKYNGDFMKSSKCWICEGDYVEMFRQKISSLAV